MVSVQEGNSTKENVAPASTTEEPDWLQSYTIEHTKSKEEMKREKQLEKAAKLLKRIEAIRSGDGGILEEKKRRPAPKKLKTKPSVEESVEFLVDRYESSEEDEGMEDASSGEEEEDDNDDEVLGEGVTKVSGHATHNNTRTHDRCRYSFAVERIRS